MNIDFLPPRLARRLRGPLWMLRRKLGRGHVRYRDLGVYGGAFDVPTHNVQARLPAGFTALDRGGGLSEVRIVALELRQVDGLAPHRELAVLAPVQFRPRDEDPIAGYYVFQLPVTTEEARKVGVEIAGFPSFVAEITIRRVDGAVVCYADHAGQHILTMRVRERDPSKVELKERYLSVRDDHMVVSTLVVSAGELAIDAEPGGVTVELGNHAIADQLRELAFAPTSGRALFGPQRSAITTVTRDVAQLETALSPRDHRVDRFGELLEART